MLMLYFALLYYSCAHPCSTSTEADHGKAVDIFRRQEVFGRTIKFTHKGILYVPSQCKADCLLEDAERHRLIPHLVYIIHLWDPSDDLTDAFKSVVRIDPLHVVTRGDACMILDDEADAIPRDVAVSRAVQHLGGYHRGHRYNFIGNNCGNFVSWAKYGNSERDVQIWERLNHYTNKLRVPKRESILPVVRKVTESYYRI